MLSAAWLARLPGQCEVCRSATRAALCADCVARFAAPRPRCRRCALPLAAGDLCGECRQHPPPFEHTACAADYGFPWDGLVAALKFHGRVELAAALAPLVANAAAALPVPEVVVPVPLSARRLAERGYNQAWEIARRAARQRGVPARTDLLERLIDTPPQAELGRAERLANLRAAFHVPPSARAVLAGRRIALVDDVATTGTTLREAAAALRQAGAAAVDAWILARTPD
ncbi:ComF family protein [Rubrivivax benzoatilyticus]|uniref:ComF family protein n=1 Tax=Rubrivivax benzoatilyticus TaxID=316997 RepID=A0ABX0HWY2_9BURK|nr:phosphoribosyltransferase family protein [Rubrivivax benzoatilyticus]EGJ08696.1 putative phosphoribosyl transferase [Rubrivivax benzoatilyticus JA2 = ATCC BAA-35]NHK97884.1 ComF family protein [Rubrivivax benzoatilyticus]NHL23386.1 ComF family protein [Rubrivivax benzoatilyticus]